MNKVEFKEFQASCVRHEELNEYSAAAFDVAEDVERVYEKKVVAAHIYLDGMMWVLELEDGELFTQFWMDSMKSADKEKVERRLYDYGIVIGAFDGQVSEGAEDRRW